MKLYFFIAHILLVASMSSHATAANDTYGSKRVALVGASIGKEWRFDQIGQRIGRTDYVFEYSGRNAFDKTPLIEQIVKSPDKPYAVLLKECSTYFPGDEAQYRRSVEQWVRELRQAGIEPVLVTTAPVGEPTGWLPKTKIWIKRALGKPTWLDSVTGYNDWLRAYAREQNLALFDLEAAVRRNEKERWLRAEYDSGDLVHLNPAGYRAMDQAFAEFLAQWRRNLSRR